MSLRSRSPKLLPGGNSCSEFGTSGTSGSPKGVVHTVDSLVAAATITGDATDTSPSSRWLACLPLHHIGGFSVLTRAHYCGASVSIDIGAKPAAIDQHATDGATHVSLVSAHLPMIQPERWTRILLGGSRAPSTLPPNAVATYGMTETGGGVVYSGQALRGTEVQVTRTGQILLRCPSLLRCYRGDTPEGIDAVDSRGWFHTSDVGRISTDGQLSVDGRIDDVIITGGHKVYPDAVEQLLATIPGIASVAVVGTEDERFGQIVTAAITVLPGSPVPVNSDMQAVVDASLPDYCRPRRIVVMDQLPTAELNKISRRLVRDAIRRSPAADDSPRDEGA